MASAVFTLPSNLISSSASVIRTCGILICFAGFISGSYIGGNYSRNDLSTSLSSEKDEGHHHYTDQWAVYIIGGKEVANSIAKKHGFVNTGE
ncbi:unnamed protein product, partial [Allacma fusca]